MTEMQINPNILIVDDVPGNIKILAEFLSDGYNILIATSGKVALKIVESHDIDLIILDIGMPEMNGYEVCERINASVETASIPIIFVTAKRETEDEAKGLGLGAVDYITKPVRSSILQARVKTQLTLKSLRDSLEEQVAIRTEELQRSMTEVQNSERIKSEFIEKVSYELRTPLNSIITPVSILMDRIKDSDNKENLKLIQNASNSLLNLVNGILDFSGLDKETTDIEETFTLDVFLQDIDKEWKLKANKKGLNFTLKTDHLTSPAEYFGKIRYLRQSITQLLDNAVKFTDLGDVVLSVNKVSEIKGLVLYHFEISDTGIGVAQEKADIIFEPSKQVRAHRSQ
jgi:two-component system, sensor histidine kinase and response regulator